ncbi:MAG: class I SAM-dependent methyltransferase [Nanoarchaeota archaeon]|nr:class I SAM-dependent methyltransferase [Nanoarchaeota archaeon]MBU4300094.1 class I SAM-dependent methyltransferase [Nanoarchaeota archaeon]MBU4452296.1 class I SAM-dependent methyltransferase [Nanoarchaeota archaeon]MCG2723821.1 class I SAM-dependent methyltransferase [archaeon]
MPFEAITKEETKKHYNALEEFTNKSDPYYFKRRAEHLLQFLSKMPKSSKILNLGCGDGRFTRLIKDCGFRDIVDADISSSLLKSDTCRKRVLGDAENISFKKEMFDAIIMTDVIEHIENRNRAINELQRVLKKNGELFITYPNSLWVPALNALGKIGIKVDAKDGRIPTKQFEKEIEPYFKISSFTTIIIMSKLPSKILTAFEKIEVNIPKKIINRLGLMHVYIIKKR